MYELQTNINTVLNELESLLRKAEHKGFNVYDQDHGPFFLPDYVLLYPKD